MFAVTSVCQSLLSNDIEYPFHCVSYHSRQVLLVLWHSPVPVVAERPWIEVPDVLHQVIAEIHEQRYRTPQQL